MNPLYGKTIQTKNTSESSPFHTDFNADESKPKLFSQPRDTNRIIEEPKKFSYIQPVNRVMSPRKRLFVNCRENTKPVGKSVPQIDLTKAPRQIFDNCAHSERHPLIPPREIMKYQEIEGSHPKKLYNANQNPNTFFEDNVLPNKPKLFKQPRNLNIEVDGSHPKPLYNSQIRSSDKLVEEAKKNLFSKPRDINRLIPDERRVFATRAPPTEVEPPVPQRNLFQQPREVMKYAEVGSPRPLYPKYTKKNQPDHMSEIFSS